MVGNEPHNTLANPVYLPLGKPYELEVVILHPMFSLAKPLSVDNFVILNQLANPRLLLYSQVLSGFRLFGMKLIPQLSENQAAFLIMELLKAFPIRS
jgi:hypothetical protein